MMVSRSPTPSDSDVANELQCIANIYSLLGRMWLSEVDASLVSDLRDTKLGEAFVSVGGAVPELDSVEALAAEYCRLLIGPKDHLPPFQSVWERGELQSDTTSSVQKFAGALRYEPTNGPVSMMDHIGIQLELMGIACSMASETLSTSDDSVTKDDESTAPEFELAREFFRRHLLWPSELLESVHGRAELTFYKSLAKLTAEFLDSEQQAWLDA